jgi:hypothetical protein
MKQKAGEELVDIEKFFSEPSVKPVVRIVD